MELHSYAKRRASKKWNIEQKRKLVDARINYDSWFNSKPSNSVVPWKKVLSVAKLDDFNVFFVRKQWSNMLTKYKQYKQTRLDGIGTNKSIDTEIIQRINQEWEFFEAIHTFMTRKTTNLHSYAVTQKFLNASTSSSSNSNIDGNNKTTTTITTTPTTTTTTAIADDGGSVVEEGGITMSLSRTLEEQNEMKPQMLPTKEMGGAMALMKLQHDDCVKENIPNNNTILLKVTGISPKRTDDMQQQHHHHHHHHRQQHDNMFSSDTNEEYEVICGTGETETDTNDIIRDHQARNTDHDFYSKRKAEAAVAHKFSVDERQLHHFDDTSEESIGTEYVFQSSSNSQNCSLPSVMENIELHTDHQLHYFADTSEESMGTEYVSNNNQNCSLPSVMENIELHTEDGRTFEIKTENISQISNMLTSIKQENLSQNEMMPSTSTDKDNSHNIQPQPQSTSTLAMPASSSTTLATKLTERDKYYRHKRRFNRRLEKRFDAILHVMGQVVKNEYPDVDIQPLMDTITSTASGLSTILSSESEDNPDDNCEGNNNRHAAASSPNFRRPNNNET